MTDQLTGGDTSHEESDDEMTSLPTATDLIAEVGASFNSLERDNNYFNQYPTAVETAADSQNDNGDNGANSVVDPRPAVSHLLLESSCDKSVYGG